MKIAEGRNVFFTSDTHFGHQNIIKYCNRPWKTAAEMDKALIVNWNAVVGKEDVVFHLGDVACGSDMTPRRVGEISYALNGFVYVVTGNHDGMLKHADGAELLCGMWNILGPMAEVEHQYQRIVLSHYGLRTWRHDLRGVWHLYGHSHGGLPPLGKSCDVGVDVADWNYRPIPFERLKERMDVRETHKAPAFAGYTPKDSPEGAA